VKQVTFAFAAAGTQRWSADEDVSLNQFTPIGVNALLSKDPALVYDTWIAPAANRVDDSWAVPGFSYPFDLLLRKGEVIYVNSSGQGVVVLLMTSAEPSAD